MQSPASAQDTPKSSESAGFEAAPLGGSSSVSLHEPCDKVSAKATQLPAPALEDAAAYLPTATQEPAAGQEMPLTRASGWLGEASAGSGSSTACDQLPSSTAAIGSRPPSWSTNCPAATHWLAATHETLLSTALPLTWPSTTCTCAGGVTAIEVHDPPESMAAIGWTGPFPAVVKYPTALHRPATGQETPARSASGSSAAPPGAATSPDAATLPSEPVDAIASVFPSLSS
ncbi:MAG TPA: hypothetical protein VMD59_14585 [Acidimicrobiales bacterium]|nr:hypothetical protein [Acidimicrobiales bacterium]